MSSIAAAPSMPEKPPPQKTKVSSSRRSTGSRLTDASSSISSTRLRKQVGVGRVGERQTELGGSLAVAKARRRSQGDHADSRSSRASRTARRAVRTATRWRGDVDALDLGDLDCRRLGAMARIGGTAWTRAMVPPATSARNGV